MSDFLRKTWCGGWLWLAVVPGLNRLGRTVARASAGTYKKRRFLGGLTRRPWLSPRAEVLLLGPHRFGHDVFVDDGCVLHHPGPGGRLELADRVTLWRDVLVQIGNGGSVSIGADTHIQAGTILTAFGRIEIGKKVQIAPRCALYPYSHEFADLGRPIQDQPLSSKGGITIEDDVWLGYGVVVLDGVCIGRGAVVGAGSVVTRSVDPLAIVAGNPARVLGRRDETKGSP